MNRSWFLFFGGLGIFISILGPTLPIPPEWHGAMDKLPIAITSFLTFVGNQNFDRNPDGSKSGTGDGTKGGVAVIPVVAVPESKEPEPLIKP